MLDQTHTIADVVLADEAGTRSLAALLAGHVVRGDVIALEGTLGMGKTAFARALINALPGPEEEVPSPTFTLVQPYDGPRGTVWHCDLYRLADPDELPELGIEQGLAEAVLLVEWPDRLGPWLPADRLELALEICEQAEDARRVTLAGYGAWAERVGEMM